MTFRPKSLAICGRGWKATKLRNTGKGKIQIMDREAWGSEIDSEALQELTFREVNIRIWE